jgi:hypothetical protein
MHLLICAIFAAFIKWMPAINIAVNSEGLNNLERLFRYWNTGLKLCM